MTSHPSYIYLYLGVRPVLNATVYLDVEIETENGTGLAILPLQMLDNGNGGKICDNLPFLKIFNGSMHLFKFG